MISRRVNCCNRRSEERVSREQSSWRVKVASGATTFPLREASIRPSIRSHACHECNRSSSRRAAAESTQPSICERGAGQFTEAMLSGAELQVFCWPLMRAARRSAQQSAHIVARDITAGAAVVANTCIMSQ